MMDFRYISNSLASYRFQKKSSVNVSLKVWGPPEARNLIESIILQQLHGRLSPVLTVGEDSLRRSRGRRPCLMLWLTAWTWALKQLPASGCLFHISSWFLLHDGSPNIFSHILQNHLVNPFLLLCHWEDAVLGQWSLLGLLLGILSAKSWVLNIIRVALWASASAVANSAGIGRTK